VAAPNDSGGFDETLPATPADPAMAATQVSGDGEASGADELAVGARLGGRYEITGFLGRGGMGAVYLARDEALDKLVALKVVARKLAGTGGVERLRNEVLLAQQVTHPGVCRTYDLEEADGRWLVKMEHVAGETLARRIARGPVPVDEALGVARAVVEALAAAHKQGVVHRDLKPANVMIEEGTGRVVLMDFGIARAAARSGDTGDEIAGTPDYMAPEQVRADAVDGRTDLYALGCVLFHMIAGRVVFPARTPMAAGLRHVEDEPPDLAEGRPDVPAWLARAVRTLLAKSPERRPADAAAALALLAGPQPRSRRGLVITGAVAVAAGVAIFLVARRGREQAPPPRPEWRPVVVEPQPAYDENAEAPTISPDGTLVAVPSDRERTGHFRVYVSPLAGGPARAITPPAMNAVTARWTHDGAALLVTDATEVLGVWRFWLDNRAQPELVSTSSRVEDCNGRWVRQENGTPDCESCQALVLREHDGREREVLRLPPGEALIGYRCDRAGTQIAYARAPEWGLRPRADLWLVPVEGGPPRQLTRDGKRNVLPVFHPDGRSILFTSARGGAVNLWELPLTGGEPVRITDGEGDDLGADITPDGSTVVFNVDITWRALFARAPDGAVRRLTATRSVIEAPSATSDGTEVIATDISDGRIRIVAISTANGGEREIADGAVADTTLDGAEIVYATVGAPATILARPRAGGEPRTLGTVARPVIGLRVADGKVYLELAGDGAPEPWTLPLAGGEAERAAAEPTCVVLASPDGEWVLEARCGEVPHFHGVISNRRRGSAPPLERKVSGQLGGFEPSSKGFVYATLRQIRRLDLVTGKDVLLFEAPNLAELTVGPDGTIYYTELVGRVRRQLITNFGERPRP
jgi:Tol biopolymer transport system component